MDTSTARKRTMSVRVDELENALNQWSNTIDNGLLPEVREKIDSLDAVVSSLVKNINGIDVTTLGKTVDRLEIIIDGDEKGHDIIGIRKRVEKIEKMQKQILTGVIAIIVITLLTDATQGSIILSVLQKIFVP